MADKKAIEGVLNWLENEQSISISVNYEDDTPTPPLVVTPGDTDGLIAAGKKNAVQMATKMGGPDVRETMAQMMTLMADLVAQNIISLKQAVTILGQYQDHTDARVADVEQRQTASETKVTDTLKDMTDKAAETGEGYGPEVVDARHSDIYGKDYDTVGEHIRAIEAAIAPYIASTSATATIPVNLGRQVPISVSYYEYALGTEPDGLGTGPYGLGGSEPQDVPYIAVTWTDSNTAQVALPVTYKDVVATGTLKAMANGSSWTLTAGYKTLRFVADA